MDETADRVERHSWCVLVTYRMVTRVGKKHNPLKKSSFIRLFWINPDKILCFFKCCVFSKMFHGGMY